MPEPQPTADAATVVILRDGSGPEGDARVEVLLLERHGRGSFAGAWAFPGGRVDPGDSLPGDLTAEGAPNASGLAGARGAASAAGSAVETGIMVDDDGAATASATLAVRRAAVRETREETGLVLGVDELVDLSCWTPPQRAERRLRTWFFLAADPGGEVVLNDGEHVGHVWLPPAVALERHAAGELALFPPTWVTLHGLVGAETAALAIARAAARAPELYASVQLFTEDGQVEAVLWHGDAQYADPAAVGDARHRLRIASRPWVYERTPGEG